MNFFPRLVLSCFLLVIFAASANCAPINTAISLKPYPTINNVKKINFPYKPIPVAAQPASGSTDTTPSGYTPCEKYGTGAGMVLTSANLVDSACVCTLSLFNVTYNYTALSQLTNASAPFATLVIPPLKNTSSIIATVAFGKMPRETRTYVLTLKMDKITTGGYFIVNINGTEFRPDQILYNSSTKEHRILFSFAPTTSQMSVMVSYVNSSQTTDAKVEFHYAQLIRLD